MLGLERILLTNGLCVFGLIAFIVEIWTKNKISRKTDMVNNDELKVMVDADPFQTTKELASWFDVSLPSILDFFTPNKLMSIQEHSLKLVLL